MVTLVERLRAKADSFYGVRERLGFKQKVYILTRTWPTEIGMGTPTDTVVRVTPAPGIMNLAHKRMITPHGESIIGDIMLTGIAYNRYTEAQLGNTSATPLTEKFYLIDGKTYSTASIEQKFVSWQVVLKKMNKNLWDDSLIPMN